MKKQLIHNIVLPGLLALSILAGIRLLDSDNHQCKFWGSTWRSYLVEAIAILIFTFAFHFTQFKWKQKIESRQNRDNHKSLFAVELGVMWLIGIVLIHLIIVPIFVLTTMGLTYKNYYLSFVIPALIILLYHSILCGNNYAQKNIKNAMALQVSINEKLEEELKFLKAQYHPHFLLNGLNTIYFQMDEDVLDTKKTIETFADLLRYQLEGADKQVSLKKELEYVNKYIELLKTRTSERLDLKLNFMSVDDSISIYPLLLMPIVENAFKYLGGDYKLSFSAEIKENLFIFKSENDFEKTAETHVSTGIGLVNLKRRLSLLYANSHELKIIKTDHQYKVELQIVC